jgi:hypothetical protein
MKMLVELVRNTNVRHVKKNCTDYVTVSKISWQIKNQIPVKFDDGQTSIIEERQCKQWLTM